MKDFWSHSKVRETTLFAVFTLFLSLAFFAWARFDSARQETKHNMEFSLRQCGEMIQNGKKEDLLLIINKLFESDEFRFDGWGAVRWQAYDMSKSFREAMLIETDKVKKNTGVILLTGFLIWCACFVVLMALHLFHVDDNLRLCHLMISVCISVFFLFSSLISPPVDMGYRGNGIKFDLESLQRALALPEFPQKMLEELQNPQMNGPYTYLSYQSEIKNK